MKYLGIIALACSSVAHAAEPIKLYRDFSYGMKESEATSMPRIIEITPTCSAEFNPNFTKVWQLPGLPDLTEETYKAADGTKVKRLKEIALNVTRCDYDAVKMLLREKYGEPTDLVDHRLESREELVWHKGNVEIRFAASLTATIYYRPYFGTTAL